jgi:hypothetical protein
MRRFFGPVLTVALALAPLFNVAKADVLHDVMRSFAAQSDLRAAYAKSTFDTVPAELEADRSIVLPSHIHGLAFVAKLQAEQPMPTVAAPVLPAAVPTITLAYDRVFTLDDALDRYDAVAIPSAPRAPSTALPRLNTFETASARQVSLAPSPSAMLASGAFGEGTQQAAFDARLQDAAIAIPSPVRVGAFTIAGDTSTADFTALAAHDAQLTAGTVVSVRAGSRSLNFSVVSDYERLTDANALTFSQSTPTDLTRYEGTSALAQLPGGNPALLIPNYADVTSRGLNAGLAVPVNGRLTVGVGYGAQRLTGSYGTSFVPNLDANNYSYLGNITFSLPRFSSAITLSARQNRYQDNLTPFTLQQTRADLNFTVKF